MSAPATKPCQNCGAEIDAAAETCPKCGARVSEEPQAIAQGKKIGIAVVASVVLPGLGQIYNGQTRKAIVFIIVALMLLFLAATSQGFVFKLAVFTYAVVLLYSVYDSYNSAKLINEGAT